MTGSRRQPTSREQTPSRAQPTSRARPGRRRLARLGRLAGGTVLVAAKAATVALTIEAVLHPDAPRYRGKAMRIRALGYGAGLALLPVAWSARGRREPYPIVADLAVTTPLLIDAAGNRLGIYDLARLDDLVHGVNSAALSSLFGALVSPRLGRGTAAAATVAFGVTGELLFDAMEYLGEHLGFDGLGLSPEDTIADVAAATLGALLAAGITWMRWERASADRLPR